MVAVGAPSQLEVGSAQTLVVAGGHDEASLGWAAAEAWLARSSLNRVLLTVRSERAREFVEAKRAAEPERIDVLQVDWAGEHGTDALAAFLEETYGSTRVIAGAVHAIAGAEQSSFTEPAHAVHSEVYLDALNVTTISLFRLVAACRERLAPNAGIVTFGFGEFGVIAEEYGGALSVAKIALAQAIVALGISLGREMPPARTLEIVTGFIPTYGARGVTAGISRRHGRRISVEDLAVQFARDVPLEGTNPEGQRAAAGELAVSFVLDEMFKHTTGERIHVDGGWATRAKSALPPNLVSDDG